MEMLHIFIKYMFYIFIYIGGIYIYVRFICIYIYKYIYMWGSLFATITDTKKFKTVGLNNFSQTLTF